MAEHPYNSEWAFASCLVTQDDRKDGPGLEIDGDDASVVKEYLDLGGGSGKLHDVQNGNQKGGGQNGWCEGSAFWS